MRYTLKQIEHAEALASHRSFGAAAKALHLTQPALTRSIKSLESSLGGPLFDRVATGVEPTKFGLLFLERARQLLANSKDMQQELAALLGMEVGSLTLATGPYPGDYLVPEVMARLIGQHPKFSYCLYERDWREIPAMVLEHRVELAIADIGTVSDDPRFETELLIDDPLLFTCRRDHPLANRNNVPLEEIGQYPIAGNSSPPRMADFLAHPALAGSVIRRDGCLGPRIEVATFSATRRILLSSNALTIAPACLVEPDLESGALTFIDTEPLPLRMNSGFIFLAGRTCSPAADRFMEETRAVKALIDERTVNSMEKYQQR